MQMAVWLLLATSLLLAVVAAMLWQGARAGTRRRIEQGFVDQQIARRVGQRPVQADEPIQFRPGAARRRTGPWGGGYFLLRAGVEPNRRFVAIHVLAVVAAVVAGLALGPLAVVVLPLMVVVLAYFRLWLKAQRRHRAMVRQIPEFLDRVVRMMTVGHSIVAAFHHATNTSVAPLNEVMGTAVSLNRSGRELHECLRHVSRQYGLRELYLVAAVVGLATQFGGRSDQVLERMAAFMRDLEQARNEMVAMSAELRLSAWVLGLLPVGLACFMLAFNSDLFIGMWEDPLGSRMLIGAAVLQLVGCYVLYRMAKSL